MKLNALLVSLVIFALPALQAETIIDAANAIISTERVFSVTFILFLLFLGKQVWPWYVKQYEAKQRMDYDYRMAQLAAEERQEERQGDLMERIINSHSEIKEALASLDARIGTGSILDDKRAFWNSLTDEQRETYLGKRGQAG